VTLPPLVRRGSQRIGLALLLLLCVTELSPPTAPAVATQGRASGVKVEIVSLKDGESVHGSIRIEAKVNRPEELDCVEFYFQEPGAEDRYSWKDFAPPYFWGGDGQTLDTTLFDDGPASAVAFGIPKAKGAPVVEHRVKLVIDNGKPKVKILSPKEGAAVSGNIVVRVDASDPKGIGKKAAIHAVSVFLDGGLVQRLTSPPFQVEVDTCLLTRGLHSLRAVAADTEGLTGADTIMIEVGASVGS
jgi:hypothetical protein